MPVNLWCVHGNLQLPSVWDFLDGRLVDSSATPMVLHKENLWDAEDYSFDGWASAFLGRVSRLPLEEKPWIMGYSLGGRLAWHALLKEPEVWAGGIIIAAHPGISDPEMRRSQLARDVEWARRFQAEPWEPLMDEWNQMPVFGGIKPAEPRDEQDYSRQKISRMFSGFSKGNQPYFGPQLARSERPPMVYISGEGDEKYTRIGVELSAASSAITHVTIPDACHRVPWENSPAFVESIQYFIDSVNK